MNKDQLTINGETLSHMKERATDDAVTRAEEHGDVAEPDAPATADENTGMSTILDAGPGTGVQENTDER